jgi:hypothetical protein
VEWAVHQPANLRVALLDRARGTTIGAVTLTIDFLRPQVEAEPLTHHAREEAADRATRWQQHSGLSHRPRRRGTVQIPPFAPSPSLSTMARVVIDPAVPDRETLDNEIARLSCLDGVRAKTTPSPSPPSAVSDFGVPAAG